MAKTTREGIGETEGTQEQRGQDAVRRPPRGQTAVGESPSGALADEASRGGALSDESTGGASHDQDEALGDIPSRDALFRDSKQRIVEAPLLEGPVADTHAHLVMLDDPALALARCAVVGVDFVVTVVDPTEEPERTYTDLAAWREEAADILATWGERRAVPRCRVLIGCHPHGASCYNEDIERLLIRLAADGRTAGIGEIGLDYHYDYSPRPVQQKVFRRQIRLAHKLGLPIALHVREAHEDALRILQEEGIPQAGALLHCFNLDYATLEPFLELGCLVAFGGPLTFAKSDETRAAAARVPRERVVTETDAPYMAPVPLRGTTCGPEDTVFTAARLAEVFGLGETSGTERRDFFEQVYHNALRFLDRAPSAWQADEARPMEPRELLDSPTTALHVVSPFTADPPSGSENPSGDSLEASLASFEQELHGNAAPFVLIVSGSPHKGRSLALAQILEEALAEDGIFVRHFLLSENRVEPCRGCGACSRDGVCVLSAQKRHGALPSVSDGAAAKSVAAVAGAEVEAAAVAKPDTGAVSDLAAVAVAPTAAKPAAASAAASSAAASSAASAPAAAASAAVSAVPLVSAANTASTFTPDAPHCPSCAAASDRFDLFAAMLDRADGLIIVSPLYFAGPPSQLKALYDRLQPYWVRRYLLHETPRAKRPAQLFYVGEGGDPYGAEALVTTSKSALAVAGFTVEKINDFVGFEVPSARPLREDGSGEAELERLRAKSGIQADLKRRAEAICKGFVRSLSRYRGEHR